MGIWYVDPVNGNDANYGNTFELRKKKLTGFNTTQLLSGDEIRIIGTPANLIGDGWWQNGARYITMREPLPVAQISDCEVAWTPSTNVTATMLTGSGAKQGNACTNIVVAAAFTTGKIAHFPLPSQLDLSGFQQISMWIKLSSTKAAGTFTLDLCSDTAGTVVVNSITVPALTGLRWAILTLDNGAPLSATVNSIRLTAVTDPATVTINMDHIIACLAPSAPNCVTLNSLIGKNTENESFYGIQSIVGSTVILDNDPSTGANTSSLYYGTTETVPTYFINPIRTPMGTTVYDQTIKAGMPGSEFKIIGGWNTTDMSTQIGETWFDGQHGGGTGMSTQGFSYLMFDKLGFVRYDTGFITATNTSGIIIGRMNCNNNSSIGYHASGTPKGLIVNELFTMNNRLQGCDFTSGTGTVVKKVWSHGTQGSVNNSGVKAGASPKVTIEQCSSQGALGIPGLHLGTGVTIKNAQINDNAYGIKIEQGCTIYGLTANLYRNSAGSFDCSGVYSGTVYTKDFSSADTALTAGLVITSGTRILQQNANGVPGLHRITFSGVSYIESSTDSQFRHTQSGLGWRFAINGSNLISNPVWMSVAKVYCVANKKATATVWAKKDSPNSTGQIYMEGGQLAGLTSTMVSTWHGNPEGQWGLVTLEFTPTESGIVELLLRGYSSSGGSSIAFDDFNFVQES